MTAWIRLLVAAVALSGFAALPACEDSAEDNIEDIGDDVEDMGDDIADDLDDMGE